MPACSRGIDLAGCTGKPMLMLRMATALDFPAGSGLAMPWRSPARPVVVARRGLRAVVRGAADVRDADETSFEIPLDLLDEASSGWRARSIAFLGLPRAPRRDFVDAD